MKSQSSNPIRKWRTRFGLAQACLALGAALPPAGAVAQTAESCGAGVELHLSAPEASQGSLLLLEVRSQVRIAELTAKWNERDVAFWQPDRGESAPAGTALETRRALLGVDLEKPTGTYELLVNLQYANGQRTNCTVKIPIRMGKFVTEKLQVGKQFVEPSPEQVQRANEERQKLREIFDRASPERLWTGKFRVPLDGVMSGKNFGTRRVLNGQPGSPHTGVDFPASTGTPVHAAQRGRVALAEELFFSGNTVVLDHGLGVYTFYGHLSEINVKVGDVLEPGAILGKVGATGRVTGPHLHWGLTVERARVNPLQIVPLLQND